MNKKLVIGEQSEYEGFKQLGVTGVRFQGLETFPKPSHIEWVRLVTEELTSFCPVTNQPDIYKLDILYRPIEKVLETKSLKLYLEGFRDVGIFGEVLANKIVNDLYDVLNPVNVEVTITQNIRGGIQLKAGASKFRGREETGGCI